MGGGPPSLAEKLGPARADLRPLLLDERVGIGRELVTPEADRGPAPAPPPPPPRPGGGRVLDCGQWPRHSLPTLRPAAEPTRPAPTHPPSTPNSLTVSLVPPVGFS